MGVASVFAEEAGDFQCPGITELQNGLVDAALLVAKGDAGGGKDLIDQVIFEGVTFAIGELVEFGFDGGEGFGGEAARGFLHGRIIARTF
jgi:hypothetical protein